MCIHVYYTVTIISDVDHCAVCCVGIVRVREAAMTGLEEVCQLLGRSQPAMAAVHMEQAVCLLVQQANEKIDRTRALACRRLASLLHYQ